MEVLLDMLQHWPEWEQLHGSLKDLHDAFPSVPVANAEEYTMSFYSIKSREWIDCFSRVMVFGNGLSPHIYQTRSE